MLHQEAGLDLERALGSREGLPGAPGLLGRGQGELEPGEEACWPGRAGHTCTGPWGASHRPTPEVGRSHSHGWAEVEAGAHAAPDAGASPALLAAQPAAPAPGQGTVWEGPALHLRFPLPRLPPLASPRSGTDVPLSRNSSYLVNQSLAGAPEKAIWFSAEPGGGGAGRCPAMPSDAHAFLRPRGAGLPARALAGEEGFSRPRFLLEYPQQVGVGRSGRPSPTPRTKGAGAGGRGHC